jgi:hypothetical protein
MPRWLLMYFGLLIALAWLAMPNAYADGRRGRTRYYAPPVHEEPICRGPVRGLGTQWIGEEGALDAAKKDWAERVRYDLGESYLDLSHAEGFEKRCGRTSIGSVAGQVFYRCEIIARPCKGVFGKVEGQK